MKRITITLIVLMLGFGLMAQNLSSFVSVDSPNANRDNEYQCLSGSVFSQTYPSSDRAYYGDDGFKYSRVADDYVASSSFSNIRFWGVNSIGDYTLGATETFIIRFYGNNSTTPSIPGTELYSFIVSATPVDLGINFGAYGTIYQLDIDFGTTVTLLEGWVSITRHNQSDNKKFAAIAVTDVTGNMRSYDNIEGEWIQGVHGNLMFCLGGTPAVPISNWALVIGVLLISGFIVVKFRTRMA